MLQYPNHSSLVTRRAVFGILETIEPMSSLKISMHGVAAEFVSGFGFCDYLKSALGTDGSSCDITFEISVADVEGVQKCDMNFLAGRLWLQQDTFMTQEEKGIRD